MSDQQQRTVKIISSVISTISAVVSTSALVYIVFKVGRFLDSESNEDDQDDSSSSDRSS